MSFLPGYHVETPHGRGRVLDSRTVLEWDGRRNRRVGLVLVEHEDGNRREYTAEQLLRLDDEEPSE